MTTWEELADNIRICPWCKIKLSIAKSREHVRSHLDKDLIKRSISVPFDKGQFPANPNVLKICSYCDRIPEKRMEDHQRWDCPAYRKYFPLKFKIIRDKNTIKEIIESSSSEKLFEIICCPECDEGFSIIEDLVDHCVVKHLEKPSRSSLLEDNYSNQKEEKHIPITTNLDIYKATIHADEKSEMVFHNHTNIKTAPVPHKRSILKKLAGIDNYETVSLTTEIEENIDEEGTEEVDIVITPIDATPTKVHKQIKIVLTYTNILYGHIHLTNNVKCLLEDLLREVEIQTEDGTHYKGNIDQDQKLIIVGPKLVEWFDINGVQAGCYLYLYPMGENKIEIAYVPVAIVIKKCLKATWDEKQQRVILTYENVKIGVECSEYLFRSSVNLDDLRVLNYMAKLHGSIFDVLYLGMRDLYKAGYEEIHYRDLHNMVIDKRLHPQLGSVFVKLSKNTCFHKLGNGFWAFIPDIRIERILPEALKPEQESIIEEKVDFSPETNYLNQLPSESQPQLETMTHKNEDSLKQGSGDTSIVQGDAGAQSPDSNFPRNDAIDKEVPYPEDILKTALSARNDKKSRVIDSIINRIRNVFLLIKDVIKKLFL